ncbi:UNVERIFIED_CONTAM: hypothetical protein K2H54_022526 [Gekko kuhli]
MCLVVILWNLWEDLAIPTIRKKPIAVLLTSAKAFASNWKSEELAQWQEELSRSKKVDPAFKEDRSSLEWNVTRAALKAKVSPRLRQLAEPRPCADGWEFSRPLYSVSKGAMAAIPSERIVLLAKPRELPATPSDQPRKPVHRGIVRNAKFDELSKPRIYTLDVRDPYKISKGALQYVPSPRVLEISHPVKGKVA